MNESENTMRALAEKPLLVKSRWCLVGWHRWTQWGKPLIREEGAYTVDYQTRVCASCNVYNVKVLRRVWK
jgi:hypothetical protein